MKTAITDLTLSFMKIDTERTSSDSLTAYAKYVLDCGADYIELSTEAAAKMDIDDFSENYILRITRPYDCGFCSVNRFAYASVPFSAAALIDRLPEEQPVILEVNADEYSAGAIILFLHRFRFIRRIAAIRVIGLLGDSISSFVKWCRKELFIPVDICPLNTMMSGASDAIEAQASGANMISLSFGRGYYYTSLEQFIISLHVMRHKIMGRDLIKSICMASFVFTDIFSAIPSGLARMLESDGGISAPIYDTNTGTMYRPYRASAERSRTSESALDRKVRSIGLEREIENAILDMIRKVNFSFYKEITKRNIID